MTITDDWCLVGAVHHNRTRLREFEAQGQHPDVRDGVWYLPDDLVAEYGNMALIVGGFPDDRA